MGTYSLKKTINFSSGEPLKKSNEIKTPKTSLVISKKSLTKSDSLNKSTASTVKDESNTENRIGSGLTRTTSKFLKEITSRTAELPSKLIQDSNGVGEFLMLDVASTKKAPTSASIDLATSQKTKLERENSKLSNNCKFCTKI